MAQGRLFKAVVVFWLMLPPINCQPKPCSAWTSTGSLNVPRYAHTATLLNNGEVLVAGESRGSSPDDYTHCQLYDPTIGAWTATGSLNIARYTTTATLLSTGEVLVAGGYNPIYGGGPSTKFLSSSELYDPTAGAWMSTGSLNIKRGGHKATLLSTGEVLVVGGYGGPGPMFGHLTSSELYDPKMGAWTATGSLEFAREGHTATLLSSGEVLVVGGYASITWTSARLYDPNMGVWTAAGSLNVARAGHTATLLSIGEVLVVGGGNIYDGYLTSSELYNLATGSWTATGSLNIARAGHTATLLFTGEMLVAGGQPNRLDYLSSSELYDPSTGAWTASGSLNDARDGHTASLLGTGEVLVAGGVGPNFNYLTSSELYGPCNSANGGQDPHFELTGLDGNEKFMFDFHGEPNKTYCLISDTTIQINVQMFGLTELTKVLEERVQEVEPFFTGTWMDGLGFLYFDNAGQQQNLSVIFDAALDRAGKPPFNISFNGESIGSNNNGTTPWTSSDGFVRISAVNDSARQCCHCIHR